MKFHDISVTLDADTPRYPGDPPVEVRSLTAVTRGDLSNLSALSLGTHSGTHLDVPRHLLDHGASVDTVALERCFGTAHVRAFPRARPISLADLEAASLPPAARRFLIRVGAAPDRWMERAERATDEPLTVEAARWLAERGYDLVGIDALSVDGYGSRGLPVHRTLLEAGLLILEGLDLRGVADGEYTLACFPLKIGGGDGSPVRAVLIEPPLALGA